MKRGVSAPLLMLVASPLVAQVQPHPGGIDPHLQVVNFVDGQVVQLRGALGYQLMVELSADEQIRNVAIGDTSAWQVSATRDGNRLFLQPTQASTSTNMTVVTTVRTYAFDLFASDRGTIDVPYTVQFHYPVQHVADAAKDGEYIDIAALKRRLSRYRLSGERSLRPLAISDDGEHTYIAWPKAVPIPAVYAVDRSGNEMLLNGMMGIDDIYVVDGTPQALIFRIDHNVARADRVNPRRNS